jgi:hypothetical protein
MSRTLVSFLPLLLVFAAGMARADLAPGTLGEKPDFALTSVVIKGKSTATHNFPIATSAASRAKMKLGPGQVTSNQAELACLYWMTLESINAGPGAYYADRMDGVVVGVDVEFPLGGHQIYKGVWSCDGAFQKGNSVEYVGMATDLPERVLNSSYSLAPGVGCAIVEPLVLAVGTTRMIWTFDPEQKITEHSEANNSFAVDFVVGPDCEPVISSLRPPSAGPTPIPERAMQASQPQINTEVLKAASSSSRDSFAKAFRFDGNGKVIKRPVPRSSVRPERKQ